MYHAADVGNLERVKILVEQGVGMETTSQGWTPLIVAVIRLHYDVVRYLLEQGANREKTDPYHWTPLHFAAYYGNVEMTKLLMVHGADLHARTNNGTLPIDMPDYRGASRSNYEEIKQAIRDEPRRRMDEAPGRRATDEDRHPNAAASVLTYQEKADDEKHSNKLPAGGEVDEGDEYQNSGPSSDEEDII